MTRWISVKEAARITARSKQWVHLRIDDETFKAERQVRRVDVDGNSVQDWMVAEMDRMERLWKFFYHNLPNGYHGKPKTD